MAKNDSTTPMMAQWHAVKEQFPDSLLFFRMGDFFEMFEDDALVASKILGIALTSRNKNSERQIPMCGVPHHSYKSYMMKLINAGHKVAICEQLEDPALAQGIVKRGVTRVVSPGTIIEEGELADAANNFLVAVYQHIEGVSYIAAVDVSTGEVYLSACADDAATEDLLVSFDPKELLCASPIRFDIGVAQAIRPAISAAKAAKNVADLYNVANINALGIDDALHAVPLQMIMAYVADAMLDVAYARPKLVNRSEHMIVDPIASRTLELVDSQGLSLYGVLNHAHSPMGQRLLRRRILTPLREPAAINKRLDIVAYFAGHWPFAQEMELLLSELYDIERITNRVASRRVSARELVWLQVSLAGLARIADMLESTGVAEIAALGEHMTDCGRIAELISTSIMDEPANTLKEGGIIREGYNAIVDELRNIKNNGRQVIADMEAELKRSTGISLKVSYNKVFGYYIELSKANANKVPANFERKQTLVNAERYVTPELKELEHTIVSAEERLNGIEYDLFSSIRDMIAESVELLRNAAQNAAQVDVAVSLAHAAVIGGYVRAVVDKSGLIEISDGRHPMVEAASKTPYVANDALLDAADNRLLLITGPNMAGKSTYMRSVALITIMAHMGSFVPAQEARIGMVDRVFTRVGASDNISRGASTFMVEMVETANILTHATEQSLIVLDEIGRGTSTFDGVSIAWAVTEYILRLRAKTLFATHYHELTAIADMNEGVKNCTMAVKELDGEIIFLRKVIAGAADKSYGIYVAQLAGLPAKVIERAGSVLADLEAEPTATKHTHASQQVIVRPMLIFDEDHPAIARLRELDINTLTPITALNMIAELKELAKP
ncbi:MAG: DNA mismatch repair protein MutS [Deferribacteraceae bacterium]|jgi:DNA mismatch repair protein MutS|nr:DNA mismatch repair protein MutS [Deferribacteraceae bacterium]